MEQQYRPPTTKLALIGKKTYHVFLSFRGPDVRKTLVDHLFEALSAAGLNVYKDDEKLEKGEEIWPSLEEAIKSSAIRVPIFSRGYAESAWCLKEAAAMLRTDDLIIPFFYYVDPTHVRYPQGNDSPYKQSFLKHYSHPNRHPTEEVDEWKNALLQICDRSGWSMDMAQGYEARLVKTVVNDLIKTLGRVPLEVAKHPVGMDSLKNAIVQKLNLNSGDEVVKVGIWGIGGIGKTTVAKAVYNQIYTNFEAASFISNIRATAAEPRDLRKLQNKILKDLTNYGEKVDNVDEGISLFRDRLGSKRVLMILDDVDAVEQLNALVGNWLCSGSRVIITSRNKHVLNVAQVSPEGIHEICGLEINEGLQLFCWYAFLRADPSPGFEDLSKRIVEACKGHPLSLEVIGSFLYDKQNDLGCWKEALDNIILNPDILDRLYISYKALRDEEKEIFLDIACFFIGEEKAYPIIFWKSLYRMVDTALNNLSMKSLIKIDGKGIFDMHDHLRDMGRIITEKEKEHTRLWEASHLRIISNKVNCSRLRIDGGNPQRLEILFRPGLRYLHLQNLSIEGMTKDTLAMLPPDLIWLRMEDCRLDIGINRAKRKRRHSFAGTSLELKTMQLQSCPGVDNIAISSLFSLPTMKLQHLNLGGCASLNNLPSVIGNLSELQHLYLGGCGILNNLPDTIGKLLQLKHLELAQCGNLNNLPDTIGNLSQLQHLDLGGCGSLNNLPDTIGNLSQLQHLNLGGCQSLNNVSTAIGNLSQLQHLNFGGCGSLNNVPDTIGNLSQLQHLNLGFCGSLNKLPDTIGNLSQLQHLELSVYEYLNLFQCGSLQKLPDTIGNLSQLQHLNLKWCGSLNSLPDTFGNLTNLQHLYLEVCGNLCNLPDTFGNLSQVQQLDFMGCGSLNNLPDTIGNLSLLCYLSLSGCGSLNNLPDTIGNLSGLQHLSLAGCRRLNNLPQTIGNLSQLQLLSLRECESLNNLPHTIGNLSQLQQLDLAECKSLNNLPDTIDNLSQLKQLNLGGCRSLKSLPHTIGNLSQLQHLNLEGCGSLNNLADTISNLPQLKLNMG
ncbi:hypothetical protein SUGI_0838540 [Cryptomeria japonica]|nr:hypothetical protein SUGI_0838540 [Cryptomeria japonica]